MIEKDFVSGGSSFRTHHDSIDLQTSYAPQFVDITDNVNDVIDASRIADGIAVIFSRHTTAAIKINESEPELIKDMCRFLEEIAPTEREYHHNNFTVRTVHVESGERPNAHSHCQHLVLSAGETIPVVNGRMQLGRWQRLFLIELDEGKQRRVSVQVIGV
jgi:secondary thiamine-phosphate synthase enzyme